MEAINPVLSLCLQVKSALMQGSSVRQGVDEFLQEPSGDFSSEVLRWMGLINQHQWEAAAQLFQKKKVTTQHLMTLLALGVRGESIYEPLLKVESEIIRRDQADMDQFIKRLPYMMMVPLFLLQLPALGFLLFGPLLNNFFHSFGVK